MCGALTGCLRTLHQGTMRPNGRQGRRCWVVGKWGVGGLSGAAEVLRVLWVVDIWQVLQVLEVVGGLHDVLHDLEAVGLAKGVGA